MPNWHDQPTCDDQAIVRAPVTEVHQVPNRPKKRAVTISAGQICTLEWEVCNEAGMAIDLRECLGIDTSSSSVVSSSSSISPSSSAADDSASSSSSSSVASTASECWLRFKETADTVLATSQGVVEIQGAFYDAQQGLVRFPLAAEHTECHGIYLCEVGVFNAAGALVIVNSFYLVINPSQFGRSDQARGMLTIPELRLFLRDNAAVDNELLDTVQFDAAEIALAIESPVLYWNESLPVVSTYTTQNFPYRYHWKLGASAQLFLMIAEWYRRNQFLTAAGGLQRDDMNKWQQYEQAGQQRWAEYKAWCQSRKVAANIEQGFGTFGSPYAYRS